MIDLADLIRTELSKNAVDAESLRWTVEDLLSLHEPLKLYDDCGHHHDYDENGDPPEGTLEHLDGVLVCKAQGYVRTVCEHCCAWNSHVTDHCQSNHDHDRCYPCKTIRVIGAQFGLVAK